MAQSKPRELTSEELALTQSPPASAGTAPLRVPPGTQIAIEQLNPAAVSATAASPTLGPALEATPETEAPVPKTPAGGPGSGKRKEK